MGRLTRQFFRCTSDSSAAVDCAFLLGAMVEELGRIPSCQVRGKTIKSRCRKKGTDSAASWKQFRVPGEPATEPRQESCAAGVTKVSLWLEIRGWSCCGCQLECSRARGTYRLIGFWALQTRSRVRLASFFSLQSYSQSTRLAALPAKFSIQLLTNQPRGTTSLQVGFPAHQFVHRIASVFHSCEILLFLSVSRIAGASRLPGLAIGHLHAKWRSASSRRR